MLKGVIKNETDSVDNSATNKQQQQQQHVINQSSKSKASRKVSAHDSDGDESNSSGQNGGKLDLLAKAAETIGRDEDMSFESFKEFLEKNPDHQKVQNFLKAQSSSSSSSKRPKINSMLLLNNTNLNHLSDINQALDRQASDDKVMSSAFQQAAAAAAAAALMANSNGYRGASSFEEMKLHERQQQLNKLIQNSSNNSNSNSALLESLFAGKSSDSPNLVDLSLLQTLFNPNPNPNGSSPVHPSVYNVAFENHANYLLNSNSNNHPSKNNSNHKSTTGLGEANANLMALNALAYAKSMSNGGQFMSAANPAPQHSASPGGGSCSPNSAAANNNNYPMFIGKNGKPTRPFKAYPREPLALPLGCTPALMQLQNPANNSNSNSHNSPSPGPSSKPSTGDRNKSNSPQSTPQVNTAAKPPAPPPNLNPLLSNPNLLVALQALLGQQQPAALSLENVLGVIAALTAASSSPPGVNPPASPTAPRQESPPTPAAAPSAADLGGARGPGTMLAASTASDSTADLASSLLNNSDFSSSLDISSLSALTSSDFCTQYRKRIQQAQERLLHKQKQHQHQQQQSDDSDEKSSTGKRRTSTSSAMMRKRSSPSNLNDYSNSESNSPTRFLEQSRAEEQQAERAERFMKQLNESQSMNEHQLKQQQQMTVAVAVDQGTAPGAESPVESDPRHSPTSSPDTTGEYMNYPPKKRLRMQQQDSENKEKSTNELLNEPTTATSAEFAVTTTNESPQALKPESSSKEFENDKAADELVDSTSTPPTVSNSRLFSNECLRLTRPASRYTPASTPTPLSLSISSSSSSTSGIGSCLSSSSPPLSSSSSVYSSSLTTSSSSSSSCSSSISSDPNTLFNNNINIGNITSLVGHHISRQRTVHNNSNRTLTTTTATDPPSHSSSSSLMGAATENNNNSSSTSRTINSRNSSTDDMDKDDAYKERRRKNNEAAKRSRDARRAKEDDIALRAAILERENLQLKVEVAQLKQETNKLRCMLYNS